MAQPPNIDDPNVNIQSSLLPNPQPDTQPPQLQLVVIQEQALSQEQQPTSEPVMCQIVSTESQPVASTAPSVEQNPVIISEEQAHSVTIDEQAPPQPQAEVSQPVTQETPTQETPTQETPTQEMPTQETVPMQIDPTAEPHNVEQKNVSSQDQTSEMQIDVQPPLHIVETEQTVQQQIITPVSVAPLTYPEVPACSASPEKPQQRQKDTSQVLDREKQLQRKLDVERDTHGNLKSQLLLMWQHEN